ncbi:MAG: HU family DNA-binding protein, partial [Phycisphaerales bacterium]|nr:HU family DNA-binding protein [Phycisphaerales bacterium]
MAKKTAKKAPARAGAKAASPKVKASSSVRTKSDIYNTLAEHAGVTRKQVSTMFDALNAMVVADLSKSGSGQFKIPGMFKVTVVRKPATKA